MSGHSKWAQIKRQKAVTDVKRGQAFTKLGKELASAVRQGGPNPETNPRLRMAVERAREANMPHDNIKRAIEKASGGGDTVNFDEITYEGYGPNGVAFLIEVLTDNRNRTVAELRSAFTRVGSSLGESGSVSWMFDRRGVITIHDPKADADEVALQAIDAGAEDVKVEDGLIEIYTEPEQLEAVRRALAEQKVPIGRADFAPVPKTTVPLDATSAVPVLKFIDRLEDLDDVQNVYTNADLPPEAVEAYEG